VIVGSVKTNIGHLESAAGIAGLIKSVLAMQNEVIPPHLHLKEVNPYLSLEDSRLEIGTYLRPWKRRDQPRFAGCQFVRLWRHECAHHPFRCAAGCLLKNRKPERPRHILSLSAKTESALHELAGLTFDQITNSKDALADICFPPTQRSHFEHRLAIHSQLQQMN
jgi:acyl transferase domain-containing protein